MFDETYGRYCAFQDLARERSGVVPEEVIQGIWYDGRFRFNGLCTLDGRKVEVLSPGWWNRSEGPDFRGAQIRIGSQLRTGDVEVHLRRGAWKQHGHHTDPRYNECILEVVLEGNEHSEPAMRASGQPVPCLALAPFLDDDISLLAEQFSTDEGAFPAQLSPGRCADMAQNHGGTYALRMLRLAGEWRLVNKARRIRERMERVGSDQAIYECFMGACGYHRFKRPFEAIARNLPYDRARQLALRDPFLLETAFLQVAGLLPDDAGNGAVPHLKRLLALRERELSGLRSLPIAWRRGGVRPVNYPERRLGGAALFLARTASPGLMDTLEAIWSRDGKPIVLRRAFEGLFPPALGFWSSQCSWSGNTMKRPSAPIGSGRIRSIIGNVFAPAALARARRRRDRDREEHIHAFFTALPGESGNRILTDMLPRFFGECTPPRLGFCEQQGLLQLYSDWCEPNPSCRNCPIISLLDLDYSK